MMNITKNKRYLNGVYSNVCKNFTKTMIEIKKADNTTEFKIIEKLATEILHEVYDPIIPVEHTEYFLTEFQSETAIGNQIENENFSYFLLNYDTKNVGYLGIQKLNK